MNKFVFTILFTFPIIVISQNSHTIYASDYFNFSPSELTIHIGDTVYFENLINHNAVEVSEMTYNNNGTSSNGGFELYTDSFVVFNEQGTFYYVCTPHAMMEMKGVVIVESEDGNLTHTIDDYLIELTDTSTVTDFYKNTYYNAIQNCNVSWEIIETDLPTNWDFSICFPNCFNPGVTNGNSDFSAGSQQYLNCHFYPNNIAGQGIIKMEIITNSNITDTVIWIGTAIEVSNIENYLFLQNEEIKSIYTLEGKKVDKIEPNTSLIIQNKSGNIQRIFIVE